MKRAIIVSVLEQIEKNLEERIDIEKLVVITGYSRRSLQDFFKEKCGVSIGKYIRQRKLSRSATLLKLTSQSVTDIAFRMGFDSVQSYSREFKKTFGVNPNNYLVIRVTRFGGIFHRRLRQDFVISRISKA